MVAQKPPSCWIQGWGKKTHVGRGQPQAIEAPCAQTSTLKTPRQPGCRGAPTLVGSLPLKALPDSQGVDQRKNTASGRGKGRAIILHRKIQSILFPFQKPALEENHLAEPKDLGFYYSLTCLGEGNTRLWRLVGFPAPADGGWGWRKEEQS